MKSAPVPVIILLVYLDTKRQHWIWAKTSVLGIQLKNIRKRLEKEGNCNLNWKDLERNYMNNLSWKKVELWRKDNITKLLVALWNKHVPIGTKVKYYPIAGEKGYICEETRTPAWILSNGEALVSITGRSGGVALSHIELVWEK